MSGYQGNDDVTIELRPFKHQVGGHTCVLEIGKSIICKPFVEREGWFYSNASAILKQFIPKYLGETYVRFEVKDSRKCLLATVPRALIKADDMSCYENTGSCGFLVAKRRKKQPKSDVSTEVCELGETPNLRSWSSTCIERQIRQYGFWANNQPQRFIILENLVRDFVKPCLMDLKMGIRQLNEDDNEAKRKVKEHRCADSTSATLGFRVCGSQCYQIRTSAYTFHNKYYGRSLNVLGAKEELRHFFHNGVFLRCDVIEQIMEKITSLECVLDKEKHCHLHAASLLLLYDGDVHDDANSVSSTDAINKNGVAEGTRLGNHDSSASCSLANGLSVQPMCSQVNETCNGASDGLKLSSATDVKSSSNVTAKRESCIDNCDISDSRMVVNENCDTAHCKAQPDQNGIDDVTRWSNSDLENAPAKNPNASNLYVVSKSAPSVIDNLVAKVFHSGEVAHFNKQLSFSSNTKKKCKVDMRLIDFANASDKRSEVENRPILFGLRNLKEMLNEILKEEIGQ